MSVLVFAEQHEKMCKKPAFEAVTFGRMLADQLNTTCIAITFGTPDNAADLGLYGATKVKDVTSAPTHLDSKIYSSILSDLMGQEDATILVLSHTSTGKSLAGGLAAKLNAGLVSGVNSLPDLSGGFKVDRMVFSGKAVATYEITSDIKILTLMSNSFPPQEIGQPVTVESVELNIPQSALTIVETKKQEGSIPLPEADIVVSGGRGFKGPENWGILLDLAQELGAATACSRPVADSEWRPHHEHVGQTGVTIRPNLYVAIGISGAIQHLGGVNNSKTIVVINKDSEAPFFKAADYGVIGDLFEIVPRLTEAVKRYKS